MTANINVVDLYTAHITNYNGRTLTPAVHTAIVEEVGGQVRTELSPVEQVTTNNTLVCVTPQIFTPLAFMDSTDPANTFAVACTFQPCAHEAFCGTRDAHAVHFRAPPGATVVLKFDRNTSRTYTATPYVDVISSSGGTEHTLQVKTNSPSNSVIHRVAFSRNGARPVLLSAEVDGVDVVAGLMHHGVHAQVTDATTVVMHTLGYNMNDMTYTALQPCILRVDGQSTGQSLQVGDTFTLAQSHSTAALQAIPNISQPVVAAYHDEFGHIDVRIVTHLPTPSYSGALNVSRVDIRGGFFADIALPGNTDTIRLSTDPRYGPPFAALSNGSVCSIVRASAGMPGVQSLDPDVCFVDGSVKLSTTLPAIRTAWGTVVKDTNIIPLEIGAASPRDLSSMVTRFNAAADTSPIRIVDNADHLVLVTRNNGAQAEVTPLFHGVTDVLTQNSDGTFQPYQVNPFSDEDISSRTLVSATIMGVPIDGVRRVALGDTIIVRTLRDATRYTIGRPSTSNVYLQRRTLSSGVGVATTPNDVLLAVQDQSVHTYIASTQPLLGDAVSATDFGWASGELSESVHAWSPPQAYARVSNVLPTTVLTIGVNPGQFVVLGSLAFEPSVASTSTASVDSVPRTPFLNELFTVTGATPAPTLVALTPENTGVRVSSAFSAPAATLALAPEDLTAVQTDLGAVPTQVCIVTQNTALKFGMQRSDGALNAQALRADVHAAANGALTGQIRTLGPGNFPPIVLNDIVFNAPPSVNATPSVFTEGQRVLVLLPEPLNVPVITLFESGSTTAIDAVDDVVTQGDGSDPAAVRGAVHNRPGLFVGTLLSFTDGGADGAGSMWVYASHAQAEFMQPASLNIVHQYATRQMVVSCGGPTLLAWDKAQPGTPAPFTYKTPTIAVGSATALSIGSTEAAYFMDPGEVVLDQYVIPRVDGSGVYPILIDAAVPFYTTAPSAQSVSDDALYAPPGADFPVGVIPVRPGDTVTQQWPGLVGHAVDTSPLGQSAENTTSNIVYIAVLYNPNASPGSAHGVVVSGVHFETVYTAAAQLEPGAADHLSVQHVVKPLQIDNPCAVIDGNHTVVLLRPELHPLNDIAELIYVPNVVTVCRLDAALRVAPRALPVAPASALLPVLQANTGIQATSLADAVSTQPRVPTHTTYATNCTPWTLARTSMTTPSISAPGFNAAALGLPLIPAQYTLPVVGSDGLSVSLSPRRTFSNNLSLLPSAATLQPSFLLMQDGTVSPIRNTHALPASSQPPHTWCVAPCSNGAWTAVPLHESIGVLQSTVRPDRRSVDAVGRRAGSSTDVPLDSTHVGLNAAYADALTSALQLQHSVQYGALVFDGGVDTGSQPAQPLHARLRNVSSIIPAAFTLASRVNAGAATVDAVYQFTPPLPPNATVPDNPASDEGPGCDAVGFGPLCAISIPVAFEQLFGDWGTPEPILEDVDSGVIDINAVDADVVQRVVDGVQLSALDQRYAQVRGSATRAALYIVGRLVFRHPRAGALDTREFTALFRRNVHRNMHTLDVVAVVYAVYRKALPNTVQRLLNRTPEKFRAAVSVQQELFDSVQ